MGPRSSALGLPLAHGKEFEQGKAKSSDHRPANVEAIGRSEQYQGKVKAWVYDMVDHSKQCVERYLELAKKSEKSLMKR